MLGPTHGTEVWALRYLNGLNSFLSYQRPVEFQRRLSHSALKKQFRRVQGHKQIPILLRELEALIPSKSEVVKRRKAS